MKLTNVKYIVGRSNLAVTICVPYDCPNNCFFCTSKKEYADTTDFSLGKILKSLKKVSEIPHIKDIVITGGEPFADLVKLQKLLNACALTRKNIFINTTLPVESKQKRKNILKFILNNETLIDGLNVSRHMQLKTNLEDDSLIQDIYRLTRIPIKINSVLIGVKAEETSIIDFIDKYESFVTNISFRGDYTKIIDQTTLRSLDHPILTVLFKLPRLEYLSSGGCLVCNNDEFRYKNIFVGLHRGYEHSLVIKDHNYIINDIIIKQNGDILIDWDGHEANIDEIKRQWLRQMLN